MPLQPPASARALLESPTTARPPGLTSRLHQTPIGPNSSYRHGQGCQHYSDSKNCPNVWLFQKDELTTNQENSVK